ncbi:MAG: TA0938 family protein, partial [Thermoplasmata archaeon]|nr:TA0938 family protein [Thermoplasmata archaeon]
MRTFFCCQLCAEEWVSLLDRVTSATGWPRVDGVDLEGTRWGRTGEAEVEAGLPQNLLTQLAHEVNDFPNLLEISLDEARQVVRRIARETDDLAGEPPPAAMLKTSSFPLPDHRVPDRVYLP